MKRAALVLAALALLLGGVGQARAEFIITFSQDGANVVADGTGSLNTTDLSLEPGTDVTPPSVTPGFARATLGDPSLVGQEDFSGTSGPTSFGTINLNFHASSGDGPRVGVLGVNGAVQVPIGYTSGTTLTSSDTWDNTTISGLGLTPGTYTWTWGSGANADSLVVDIRSPEPSTLTLLGIGSLGLLGYGWRRRKQAAA